MEMDRSILDSEEDEGFVFLANELLEKCGIKKRVSSIVECNEEYYVSIYQGLLGDDLKGLIKNPVSREDQVINCQCVIDSIGQDVLNVDLSHISAEKIVRGDRINIRNLLEIFAGLLEYFLEHSDHREESDIEGSDDEDDSNLLTSEHDIVSGIFQEEFGTRYPDVYPLHRRRSDDKILPPAASTKPPLPPRGLLSEKDQGLKSGNSGMSSTGNSFSGLRNSGHDADISRVSDSTNELIKLGESSRALAPFYRAGLMRGKTDTTLQQRLQSHSTTMGGADLTQYTLTGDEARPDSFAVLPTKQHPAKPLSSSLMSSTLSSSYQQQISPLDPEKDGATLDTLGVRPRVEPLLPNDDQASSEGGSSGRSSPVLHHHYHHHYHHPVGRSTATATSAKEPTIPRPSALHPKPANRQLEPNYLDTIPGISSLSNLRPQHGVTGTRSSALDRPGEYSVSRNIPGTLDGKTASDISAPLRTSSTLPGRTSLPTTSTTTITGSGIPRITGSGFPEREIPRNGIPGREIPRNGIPGREIPRSGISQSAGPPVLPMPGTSSLSGNGVSTTLGDIPSKPYASTYTTSTVTARGGLPGTSTFPGRPGMPDDYGTRSTTSDNILGRLYASSFSSSTVPTRDFVTSAGTLPGRTGMAGERGDRLSRTAPGLTSWGSGARLGDSSVDSGREHTQLGAGRGIYPASSATLSDSVFSTIPTSLRSRDISAPHSTRVHTDHLLPTSQAVGDRSIPQPPPVQREDAASELLARYRAGAGAVESSYVDSEEEEEEDSDMAQHSDSEVDYGRKTTAPVDDSISGSSEASVRRNIHERWKRLNLKPKPSEKPARRAVTFNEDIQTIPITSRMDRLRRQLDEEEDEQRQLHTDAMRTVYQEQLKSLQKQQGKERGEPGKRKIQSSPLVPKKKVKKQTPKKKPSGRLEAIYRPHGSRKPRTKKRAPVRDRKRSASASPVVGRRTKKQDDPQALLPDLYDEFPFLHVSPQTTHAMWKKQARHLSQLTKTGSDVRKTKSQRLVEEAERRQEGLLKVLKKELDFNHRLRDQRERDECQRSVKTKLHEKRQVAARARRYYDDYQLRMRSKMLKRRTQEEMIFKNLFEEGLDIQKHRVRELRQYAREKREALAQRQQNEIDSLENYYRDQFSMLADEMTRERYDVKVRQQAQEKVVRQMRSELRQNMETQIQDFQANLTRDEDSAYFRQLEADRLRREFQLALYKTNF